MDFEGYTISHGLALGRPKVICRSHLSCLSYPFAFLKAFLTAFSFRYSFAYLFLWP